MPFFICADCRHDGSRHNQQLECMDCACGHGSHRNLAKAMQLAKFDWSIGTRPSYAVLLKQLCETCGDYHDPDEVFQAGGKCPRTGDDVVTLLFFRGIDGSWRHIQPDGRLQLLVTLEQEAPEFDRYDLRAGVEDANLMGRNEGWELAYEAAEHGWNRCNDAWRELIERAHDELNDKGVKPPVRRISVGDRVMIDKPGRYEHGATGTVLAVEQELAQPYTAQCVVAWDDEFNWLGRCWVSDSELVAIKAGRA